MAKKAVDKSLLKALVPINALAPQHFNEIADKIIIEDLPAGRVIFKEGERDNRTVYLLAGEITLLVGNSVVSTLSGDTVAARHPLVPQQPRQHTAKTKTPATIARIDTGLLDVLLTWDQSSGYEVTELEAEDEDWLSRMLQSQTFQKLPPANIQKLLMSMEEYPAPTGTAVIKQGDPGDYYYIVKQGRCMVTRKASPTAQDVKLAELSVGDSFGEDALISDSKRNATVTMMTDGRLMRLAKTDFVALLREPLLAQVSFPQAQGLVREGAGWLDVRLPGEFQQGHIDGAVNIPLSALRHRMDELDSTKRYIVYCDNGGRSSTAAFLLSQHGYDVRVLTGGTQTLGTAESRAVHTHEGVAARAEVINFDQEVQARKKSDDLGTSADARREADELVATARAHAERVKADAQQILRAAEQQAEQLRSETSAQLAQIRAAQVQLEKVGAARQSEAMAVLTGERDTAQQRLVAMETAHQQIVGQLAQLQQALQLERDRAEELTKSVQTQYATALDELRSELNQAQRNATDGEQVRLALAQQLEAALTSLRQTEQQGLERATQQQREAQQRFDAELTKLRAQLDAAQDKIEQTQQALQQQIVGQDEQIVAVRRRLESANEQLVSAAQQKNIVETARDAAAQQAAELQLELAQAQRLQILLNEAEQTTAVHLAARQALEQDVVRLRNEIAQARQAWHQQEDVQREELAVARQLIADAQARTQFLEQASQTQEVERAAQAQQLSALQDRLIVAARAEQRVLELVSEIEAQRGTIAAQQQNLTADRQAATVQIAQLRALLETNEHAMGAQSAALRSELLTTRAELARTAQDLAEKAEQLGIHQSERRTLVEQRGQADVELANLRAVWVEKERALVAQSTQLNNALAEALEQQKRAGQVADQQRVNLEAQLDQARREYATHSCDIEDQLARLRQALDAKSQQAENTDTQLEQARLASDALRQSLAEMQISAQSEQTELRARIQTLQEEARAALTRSSNQAEAKIAELQTELVTAQQTAQHQTQQLHAQLDTLQQQLTASQAEIQRQRDELQSRLETLREETDAREKELKAQLTRAQQSAQQETQQLRVSADARVAELETHWAQKQQAAQFETQQVRAQMEDLQQTLVGAQAVADEQRDALHTRIRNMQDAAATALAQANQTSETRIADLQTQLVEAQESARHEAQQLSAQADTLQLSLTAAQAAALAQRDEMQARIRTLQDEADAALTRTSIQAGEHLAAELTKVRAELEAGQLTAQNEIAVLRQALQLAEQARAAEDSHRERAQSELQAHAQALENKLAQAYRVGSETDAMATALKQELERLRGELAAAQLAERDAASRAQREAQALSVEQKELRVLLVDAEQRAVAAVAEQVQLQARNDALKADIQRANETINQALNEGDAAEQARDQAAHEVTRLKARVQELEAAAQREDVNIRTAPGAGTAELGELRAQIAAAEMAAQQRIEDLQSQVQQTLQQAVDTDQRVIDGQTSIRALEAQIEQERRRAAELARNVDDAKRELEQQTQLRLAAEIARKAAQQEAEGLRAESQIMSNLGEQHIEASAAQRAREQQMLIARLEGELLESKKNVEIAVRLRGEAESTNQAFEQELARVKEQLSRGDGATRQARPGIAFILRSGLGMSLAAGWIAAVALGVYLALSGTPTAPLGAVPPPPVSTPEVPAQPTPPPPSKRAPAKQSALKPPRVDETPSASTTTPQVHALGNFRDSLRDGGEGPRMTRLPAGDYPMGSATNSLNYSETPRHTVAIKAFAMGTYEVSFADYDRFASATSRPLPSDHGWGRDNRPVINISWDDAAAYTRWLSEQTGHQYRLPSEAEWEYAAAAGTSTFYWWGNNSGENRAACFNCGSRWDGRETAPIGSFAPNRFGLYDTAGNVLEWVADCRHESYQDAPLDGKVWAGGDCSRHIARGGAFDSPVDNLRTQNRPFFSTSVRLNNLGLRVVRVD